MGNLSEKECILIESVAQHMLENYPDTKDAEMICQYFIEMLKSSFDINLSKISVTYVFRVN